MAGCYETLLWLGQINLPTSQTVLSQKTDYPQAINSKDE